MTAQTDLGPALPPRSTVHAMAVECQLLARIAIDCSLAGHRCDLPRAMAKLDQMRAVLGAMEVGGDE